MMKLEWLLMLSFIITVIIYFKALLQSVWYFQCNGDNCLLDSFVTPCNNYFSDTLIANFILMKETIFFQCSIWIVIVWLLNIWAFRIISPVQIIDYLYFLFQKPGSSKTFRQCIIWWDIRFYINPEKKNRVGGGAWL